MDIQNIKFRCYVTLYIHVGKEGFDIKKKIKKIDEIFNEIFKDGIT